MKIQEWQRIAAAENKPEWIGDLNDDCSANWAGLLLRAEWMDEEVWWWAVSDLETRKEIASSNDGDIRYRSGAEARQAAEDAAYQWLGLPSRRSD